MRRIRLHPAVLSLTLLAAPVLAAATSSTSTSGDAAVLAPVHAFFAAMSRYDQAGMRAQVLPAGMATLMRHGKPVQLALGEFVDHVKPGKARIEERIRDPRVSVDDDIAVVWAPYVFLLDGKPHHCGTDVFNLARVDGRWLIAGIADNSRDCPAR
ncbi:nuclear transport factor 2 family protein [Fulvimonas sp. R45]|uniref:nuclear transport factor 2 family protein n=1 Tax=Fulvimonas sp. R45 TaxID=3045937 RepID=UPI00265D66C7|nr:nuclear transport factor 2 family protein [Fulvimonas sp. R45]MDO1528225.1 nuclear transport factor 2 family protein [Fulvimonas sp. R45]